MKLLEPEILTHAERLADEVAACVLSGEFTPGQRLDEAMLAERFGVSRTPVREALRQLASTGLIEFKPGAARPSRARPRRNWRRCSAPWPRSKRPARGWRR